MAMPGELERLLQALIQPPQTSTSASQTVLAFLQDVIGLLTTDSATPTIITASSNASLERYGTVSPCAHYGEAIYDGYLNYDSTICLGLAEKVS